jgi:hypothetical protein
MKRAALLLPLVLVACDENLAHTQPPMDHFFFPAGIALTPVSGGNVVSGGNQALLVVSANFDLRYDKEEGATLLSVDPGIYDETASTGGSAGRPDGALVKLGPGAQLGSYAGPVAIATRSACPGLPLDVGDAEAFVASRYTRTLYRFPVGADGSVAPCSTERLCQYGLDQDLLDPAPIGIACRADPAERQSLWVSYLRSPWVGTVGPGTGWLSEFDLSDLTPEPRTIALAPGPVGDMAYDAQTDRLYAVGRFAGLTAPLYILDLPTCKHYEAGCPTPRVQTVDLFPTVGGAELIGIALSNPQPGRPRLAYVSTRIYDVSYAAAIQGRPSFDVGGALLVVELEEGVSGEPLARVRQVVSLGLGAGMVRVLPLRPGLGDLVVVPSTGDGTLQVFDDEIHAITRVVTVDDYTGAPEAGRAPYSMAVDGRDLDADGVADEALVYVAAFRDWTVSILRVPLADPASADLLRHPAGSSLAGNPLRIGSLRP